ncbi:Fe-S cluster assembly protein SufD, partial [Stenotrophomonas sp. HMWF022]
MSALLDSMAQAFCGSDARREVLDSVLRDGLPGARSESWKYTSLRQLERRSFAAAPLAPALLDATVLEDIPAPRLV